MPASLRFDPDFSPTSDRLPPYCVESEEAVLGGILFDGKAIDRVFDILAPEAFYLSTHQEIYRAVLALHSRSEPIDLMTVAVWLKNQGRLEKAGGQQLLMSLVDRVVSAVNIDLHARDITDKYTRRRLILAAHEQERIARDTAQPIASVIEASEQQLYGVAHGIQASNQAEHISESCMRLYSDLESGVSPGLGTDFYDLDSLMAGGYHPGQLTVCAGATGMGKTHYAIAVAHAIARIHKLPVVFFSCEMTREELTTRLLSSISRVDSEAITSRTLSRSDWELLSHATMILSQLPIYLYEAASPSLAEMRSALRRIQAEQGLGLVVLDYLQLLGDGDNNRTRELDRIANGCKAIAMDFHVPFLAVAQINRGVSGRADKRPTLSDLRESGAIEQAANRVLFLYRDEYYNLDTADRGIVELILAKNRSGKTGTCKMLFEPRFSLFRNLQQRKGDA